ncbi:MAG: gliding motility-associated C-terminal domain-containing protein, partial [Bacteroidota bacterium]
TATYVVTTTLNGCTSTDTVVVTSAPQPTANAGPDVSFCSGQSVSIGTAGTSGYTYSWSPASGLSSSSSAVTNVTLTNNGTAPITNNYIVNVNAFGCTDVDTVAVEVRPAPLADAGPNQLLCSGSTSQIGTTSTSGYTYVWSPASGLNNTNISNPTVTLTNSGTTPVSVTYLVTVTLNGCTSVDSVTISSGPQPTANAGPDVFICSGQSISIGTAGTTGYTYTWTPATGLSNANSAVTNATGTNTGTSPVNNTYIVNVNAFGCIDADTVTVQVRPNPVSQAGPDVVLCGSDTLVLGTSSTSGYTYSWSPATNLSNTNTSNPTLIVSNNSANPTSQTYVVTTTLNGCITTDSATITINPQPIILANAAPTSICAGDTAQLVATGATTYAWTWQSNPGFIIGTNDTLNVHPTATTNYVVTGTNSFGCSNTDTVKVTVYQIPIILATASNDTICSGDTLLLTGSGGATYVWNVQGGSVIGSTNPLSVTPNTNTSYIVTGTSANGCSSTDTVSVIVNPGATANSILGNISVCPGVNGVLYWIPNANPNSTYTWSINGGTLVSGQSTDSILVNWASISGIGTVSVIETTTNGCQSPDPVTLDVTINVILTPAAPAGPTSLCANQAQGVVYNALNTPGSTYTWTAVGGTILSGQGTSSVTVNWTVTGPQTVYLFYDENSSTSTNVCFGTSDSIAVTINPSPTTSAVTGDVDVCIGESGPYAVTNTNGSSYSWNVAGGTLSSGNGTAAINSAFPLAGNAVVSVIETNSYGCVGDTVLLNVIVHDLPAANAGPNVAFCSGQSVQLSATGGTGYQWSPSNGLNNTNISNPVATPGSTTNYIVQVTDQFGCVNADTVTVTVNPLPTITVTPASAICVGNSLPLNATGGNNYSWSPAGSLSNPNSSSPTASPSTSTVYTVVVTDQNGCVDSATIAVTVNPLPIATASNDTTICTGSSVSLIAGGGVSYSWSPQTGLNNASINNPISTPGSPITYTVTVTDQNGCTDTEDVNLALNEVPVASFDVDENVTTATCNGIETTLINTSQNATNYYWSFPDGSTSTDVNPTYNFGLSGTVITLVAQNNICYDTLTQNYSGPLLDVLFDDLVNVFTPNNDGKNDCFELGANFNFDGCSAIQIFNRWGRPVFTSGPGKYCWNGKTENTGEELPSGSYYLTVTVAGSSYKGSVTLIR